MQALYRLIRALARAGLALAAAAMLASLALIVYAVFQRYVLGAPVPWTDELVGYLLVPLVMRAAADPLLEGEHISVDILTDRLGPGGKRITLMTGLVASAATGVLILLEGLGMVSFARMVGLRSNGYLATPMWLPQVMVPIGGGLLVAASLAALWHAWRNPGELQRKPEVVRGIE
jgi:TRAP-type C4-dicarboxylate transport system permease small subunit